jgi:hypothetical protein
MDVPWRGNSEYRTKFGPKSVAKIPLKNRNIYKSTN